MVITKFRWTRYAAALALILPATTVLSGQTAVKIQVSRSNGGSLATPPPGTNLIGNPEVDPATAGDAGSTTLFSSGRINRSIATKVGSGPVTKSSAQAKSNPELLMSFDGLDHVDQRLANGGNQFSIEPPDQGLCAGNGFLMETVNSVLRIYDANGNALTGA